MIVRIEPEAEKRIDTIIAWWREHRPQAPYLFEEELDEAIERLPMVALTRPLYTTLPDGTEVRRLLLKKSEQHVYYWVEEDAGVIHVISVWGAKRGRPPLLAL